MSLNQDIILSKQNEILRDLKYLLCPRSLFADMTMTAAYIFELLGAEGQEMATHLFYHSFLPNIVLGQQ